MPPKNENNRNQLRDSLVAIVLCVIVSHYKKHWAQITFKLRRHEKEYHLFSAALVYNDFALVVVNSVLFVDQQHDCFCSVWFLYCCCMYGVFFFFAKSQQHKFVYNHRCSFTHRRRRTDRPPSSSSPEYKYWDWILLQFV